MIIAPGATSISVDVFFADDTGAAVTAKVAADFPACKWSSGSNTADTAITLSDLAAITTAHPNDNTAGGVKEREGGWYRLDIPNNVFTSAGRKILTFAETTNKRIIAPFFDVQYPDANAKQIGGQTAQLNANNLLKVSLNDILATALTEGAAGRLATAFKTFLDVATPVFTATSVNQTGDSFARLGAPAGASIAADIASLLTAVNNLNNLSALANLYGPAVMEIPDSVTVQYPFTLTIRDEEGHLIDLDGSPTVTATNGAGVDRSANLSAVAHGSTGVYTFTYGVAAGAAEEGLRIVATGAVGASARRADFNCAVADYDSITTLNAIKTKTDQMIFDANGFLKADVEDWKGATAPAMTGDAYARLGAPAGASVSADIAAVKTDTGNLVTRITATLFAGITSLAQWLGLIAGKQVGDTTARTEMRATGAGSGTYDETTDSQQAIRDESVTLLGNLQADTDDIQTRIPAALSAGGMMMSDVEEVLGTAAQPTGITPRKNVALAAFEFPMFDATDGKTLKSGLTITATRSLDGGAFAACANAVTEVGTTGVYKINLAAADMNGDTITLMFDGGATANVAIFTIVTQP